LDDRFCWTTSNLLSLFYIQRYKDFKKCEYTLKGKISSDYTRTLCFYIKHFNLKGYCEFFKKLIDKHVTELDYMVWTPAMVAADMGCLNCYESIKNFLDSKNEKNIYYAKEALKKLDKLKLN